MAHHESVPVSGSADGSAPTPRRICRGSPVTVGSSTLGGAGRIAGCSALWALVGIVRVLAQQPPTLDCEAGPIILLLRVPANPAVYYQLEVSTNLTTFDLSGMALGLGRPGWVFANDSLPDLVFFRAEAIQVFDPRDTDGDGIDDRYELEHPDRLDPLDPNDAAQDPDGDGCSNYCQYIRDLFGPAPEFISREVSLYNDGQPTARLEGLSAELSVYNANPGSGPPPTDIAEAFSPEVSVWNYGAPTVSLEALSAELSVYNAFLGSGPPRTDIAEALSQEVSIWNHGAPTAELEAISPEWSVFNQGAPTASLEAISREVSVLNFEEPIDP